MTKAFREGRSTLGPLEAPTPLEEPLALQMDAGLELLRRAHEQREAHRRGRLTKNARCGKDVALGRSGLACVQAWHGAAKFQTTRRARRRRWLGVGTRSQQADDEAAAMSKVVDERDEADAEVERRVTQVRPNTPMRSSRLSTRVPSRTLRFLGRTTRVRASHRHKRSTSRQEERAASTH